MHRRGLMLIGRACYGSRVLTSFPIRQLNGTALPRSIYIHTGNVAQEIAHCSIHIYIYIFVSVYI